MRGEGPRGKSRGDTEQWIFPRVQLSEAEKQEIVATVISIATENMFNKHFYTFGGEKFHQKEGGTIGLRGTCAVARVVMQIFDVKWKKKLTELCIKTEMIARYMDDCRTLLHPIKHGWRVVDDGLVFCEQWKIEDGHLSGLEVTTRVLAKTMEGIETFLSFTMETGADFAGGWLPTLDTNLIVNSANQVQFKYFEKPTTTNRTLQKNSAMGENAKIQSLSQDMVRRLMNTSEMLGAEVINGIIDTYAQKLTNSGFGMGQVRKIILNGIKGFENKKRRRTENSGRLRRQARDSQNSRIRKKLLAKSSWFKGAAGANKKEQYSKIVVLVWGRLEK